MIQAVEVVTVVLVAVAMALSPAHLAELPGKLRLDERTYRAVQPIYYPGFTIGGFVGDVGGTLMLVALIVVSPAGSLQRRCAIVALVAMLAYVGVFWLVTQPVNRTWLAQTELGRAGSAFFATSRDPEQLAARGWKSLRNRWEISHAVRAVLALLALVLVVVGVTTDTTSA